jgi:SET domain-containing protein
MFKVKFINMNKGRGVIATRDIQIGEIIDIAHVIVITMKEYKAIRKTVLYNYIFDWGDPSNPKNNTSAIIMSPCEFCNHDYDPNAEYKQDYEHGTIVFSAIKNIQQDEEITVNYNRDPRDKSPLWFHVH